MSTPSTPSPQQPELRAAVPESAGPTEKWIHSLLQENFPEAKWLVVNESFKHAVPKGSESHFLIQIVSNVFEEKNLLKRHRIVQAALNPVIDRIKAISLHTHTFQEHSKMDSSNLTSPNCKGAT